MLTRAFALSLLLLPAVAHTQAPAEVERQTSNPETSAQAARPRVVRISSGVMAGQAIYKQPPVYPAEARAAGVSGAIVLRAVISTEGQIQELEPISGPDELRSAALEAVRNWRYRPYLLNGQPVAVETTIIINFNLAASPAPAP